MSATVSTEKFSINLSDGSTHEVEAADRKAATTKLLKRKPIKDAGLTVIETPDNADVDNDSAAERIAASRARDNSETTPPVVETPDVLVNLPTIIADYFAAEASQDPTAPMNGSPFKQNDRLYLQLEGRGGAGKGADEFTATGLRPYMIETLGDATPGKGKVRQALIDLGFERKPFSYNHPDRGSSSASYYSAVATAIGSVAPVEARKSAPRGKAATKINAPAEPDVIIPQRPGGSDEDVALLDMKWNAYLDAQKVVQALTAEFGRNPIKKDASKAVKDAAKAERTEKTDTAKAVMTEAHEELVAWRRVMHGKNLQAAAAESGDETSSSASQ